MHLTTQELLDEANAKLGAPAPFARTVCGTAKPRRHLTTAAQHVTCPDCLAVMSDEVSVEPSVKPLTGVGPKDAAAVLGVSRATVYRRIKLVAETRPELLPMKAGNGTRRPRWNWPHADAVRAWWDATDPAGEARPSKLTPKTRKKRSRKPSLDDDVVDWGAVARG